MPRLNTRGQAAMGIGDGPGSVDTKVLLTPGGDLCWLTDDVLLAQTILDERYQVVAVREDVPPRPWADQGANAICAGGEAWLAWSAASGLFGSLGSKPQAGLVAAGSDGTLAYCPSYQSGIGLVLSGPDGQEQTIPGVQVVDRQCQVLGPLCAIWLDFRGGLRAFGRPDLKPALTPGRTRLVLVDGEVWLVYQSDQGLIAQVDGASEGYILEPRPITFNHDAVAVGSNLVVAWSVTQGEGPGDLRKVTVDRTQPRVPLVNPAEAVPTIDRPLWLGWFVFGAVLDLPANCVLPVDEHLQVLNVHGRAVAQYVAGSPDGDMDAVDRAIAEARQRRLDLALPTLAYWTRGGQAVRRPAGADIVGVEAYRLADESLTRFEARVRGSVALCPRAWLIAQGYTSNSAQHTDLAALVPIFARIARDCSNVEGILVFSAGTRATGWSDHPEVHDAWRRLAAGIPGTPALPPAADPVPPAPGPPPPVDPVPPDHPPPPKENPMKNKDEVRAVLERIFNFYMQPHGLNRAARGRKPPIDYPGDDPAFWDWVALGLSQSPEDVERQIRQHPGGEWQQQHPGEPTDTEGPLAGHYRPRRPGT